MTDAVSICNLALQRVGAKTISALSEDSTAGRACNRVYTQARDSELRAHPWAFARERVQVAADSVNPAFGAARRYALPSDNLRILPTNGRDGTDTQDDFEIFGKFIHTDHSSPIRLNYIKRITDENTFDALFVELLIARIAMDVSEKVTQSNRKKDDARLHYKETQKEARRVNAFERPPQTPPTDTWLTARL
jgi:ubiquitin|tara:strand:+ start:7177 stop:7752 length:576 start_codon:yes stop_codon:yes gene_type:complete